VPLQLIVGIILLAIYVDFYVVIVVGLMIIAFPISAVLGQKTGVLRYALQQFGDKRLKMINELLGGMFWTPVNC
jgi:predicted Co/Zn/Cd cation transporter (cation efflux family)